MASSGKKKTTYAKLARESRLRERRFEKQARKDARKRAAEEGPPTELDETPAGEAEELRGAVESLQLPVAPRTGG
jgi:hypothetical protein